MKCAQGDCFSNQHTVLSKGFSSVTTMRTLLFRALHVPSAREARLLLLGCAAL